MTHRLTPTDTRRLLAAVSQVHAHDGLATFPQTLLRVMSELVGSDSIAYNEVNPRLGRFVAVVDPPELDAPALAQRILPFVHEHPVIRFYEHAGETGPRKISDFLSQRRFRETALYREFYRQVGTEYQMALPVLFSSASMIALSFNRRLRDFTERERACLQFLRPHLKTAYTRLELVDRLQRQNSETGALLSLLRIGVIDLDRRLRITRADALAAEWLQRFFGAATDSAHLPPALARNVRPLVDAMGQEPSTDRSAPVPAWEVGSEEGCLEVRVLASGADKPIQLILQERPRPASAPALQQFGLSPREAEVLFWLTRGKSNPEIGTILGISRRTVHKHLERVYVRLGVENRTAAVALVLQTRRSDGSRPIHD